MRGQAQPFTRAGPRFYYVRFHIDQETLPRIPSVWQRAIIEEAAAYVTPSGVSRVCHIAKDKSAADRARHRATGILKESLYERPRRDDQSTPREFDY